MFKNGGRKTCPTQLESTLNWPIFEPLTVVNMPGGVWKHLRISTCMYIYMCVYIYIYIYSSMSIYEYIYRHTFICIGVCVCICMYVGR